LTGQGKDAVGMDAAQALSTLHKLDPTFRTMCEGLYPGLEPRAVADLVYKAEPGQSDVHVGSPVWRNGRGHTKGRGRRLMDKDVKRTVTKKEHLVHHLDDIHPALKKTKMGPDVKTGTRNALSTVRSKSKPFRKFGGSHPSGDTKRDRRLALAGLGASGVATAGGLHALKATSVENKARKAALLGKEVPHARPAPAALKLAQKVGPAKAAAIIGGGWGALHGVELGGDLLAMRAQSREVKRTAPKHKKPSITKAWQQAEQEILRAFQQGSISKAEAERLGKTVYAELVKKTSYGHMLTSSNIKLQTLKAPAPVTPNQPKVTPTTINPVKPAKSGAGRKAGKPLHKAMEERNLAVQGEISKLDEDRKQCFGWCSVVRVDGRDVVDKQNDLIDVGDLEASAYDYVLNSRAGGDMHGRADDGAVDQKATLIESMVFTPDKIAKMGLPDDFRHAWWIGLQVHDPDLWSEVRQGHKTKFSIHGTGQRNEVLLDD
jgi:hypothetical protein